MLRILLAVLAVLIVLSRPYLEARRPIFSLALIAGLAIGVGGADLIPRESLGDVRLIASLASGWLSMLAAEAWRLGGPGGVTAAWRLAGQRHPLLLSLPALVLAMIGWLCGAGLAIPMACAAMMLDPDAVRHALSRTSHPAAGRFAPAVVSIALGLGLLASALTAGPAGEGATLLAARAAAGLLLGLGLAILYVPLMRLSDRWILLVLLLSLSLLGWGLSSRGGISGLSVSFVAGLLLAQEARRDHTFTLLREHERSMTILLVMTIGATIAFPIATLRDPVFWCLLLSLVVARPLIWTFAGPVGLSGMLAWPMSPLVLPLAMLASSWREWDGAGTAQAAALRLAMVVAFILSELVWRARSV